MRGAAVAATSFVTLKAAVAQPSQADLSSADFLFVQSAKGMNFDKTTNKVTLTGVSPITVFFTDRPERIAGNMKTSAFIPFWSQGKDSFKSNPPNADISLLDGKGMKQVIAELQEPVLNGDDLSYTVKILQGELPLQAANVAVFIDFAQLYLAATQFAQYQRSHYRRAYWNPR